MTCTKVTVVPLAGVWFLARVLCYLDNLRSKLLPLPNQPPVAGKLVSGWP